MLSIDLAMPQATTDSELRVKLRPVFNKFDLDKSGAVSTAEMGKILKAINMEMSPDKVCCALSAVQEPSPARR